MEKKEKRSFSDGFIRFFDRFTPNAMVFAFLLTIVVAILALLLTKTPLITDSADGHMSLLNSWVAGFWNLLTFAMQMALIMITGNVIAISPPVQKLIMKLAKVPNNWVQAFFMIIPIAFVVGFIHWGLGMMVCIALLRNTIVASRDKGYKIHTPALIACAYSVASAAVGVSQAAPLYGATPGYLQTLVKSDAALAYLEDVYPLSTSVMTPWNLSQCLVGLLCIFAVGYILMPKDPDKMEGCVDSLYNDVKSAQSMYEGKIEKDTFAKWINNSYWINMVIGIPGLLWCVRLYAAQGLNGLTLNNFNFTMLMLGIVLCGTPEKFSKACIASVGAVWGVIIQFPLYAGIFGIIVNTGLAEVISNAFMAISTTKTFPFVCYIYSAILNMAVPSGGSKFVIEAPYILDVAARLNVQVPKVLLAYNWGDVTTNIIQPFWALPYLTLCHIDFKKMLPYSMFVCISFLIFCTIYMLAIY